MNINQIPKDNKSMSLNQNTNKYYISCNSKITKETPTTEGWINILKSLKMETEYDKSKVLLGLLEKRSEIVVKIGDNDNIKKEYEFGQELNKLTGFIKYLCYFELLLQSFIKCNDDYTKITNTLCKGPGNKMKIIVMPYYKLGSIATFNWLKVDEFNSVLKQSLLSLILAFNKLNIIHGDFHPGNIILVKTNVKSIDYNIPNIGEIIVPIHGLRIVIMDFENTKKALFDTQYNKVKSLDSFYYDLTKFFTLLPNFINNITLKNITPITSYIGKLNMKGNLITRENINDIFQMIDEIKW